MKKHLISLFSLFIIANSFAQSLPNGGFESWTISTYENPTGMMTSNFNEMNGGIVAGINATKTTDAYHGTYAIKLTTALSGTVPVFAFFANGDPGKSPAQGGLPYNKKPTGMRFYYKSNIIAPDTAFVLATFKKAGTTVGTYFYKITASQTAYTLANFVFSPALPVVPDTCVIAAASSAAFSNFGIPGNMLQLDSMSFTGVTSQPAGLNGSFENWTTLQDENLNNWFSNGSIQRTTDAYTGTYAIELQTENAAFGGGGTRSGGVKTGQNVGGPMSVNMGSPYTLMNDSLIFYYKYLPAHPSDNGRIFINLKKNSVQIAGFYTPLGISASYKRVAISFSTATAPDTINFSFYSSLNPVLGIYAGSDLKVDNMYLYSQKLPVSNFTSPLIGCTGQPIQLMDNSSNGANAWGWIMPGGNPGSSTAQNPVVVYNTIGTKTITMVSNNSFGGGSAISKTITINAVPNVNSTSTITSCSGNNAVLVASGATTYTWSTGANTASIAITPSTTTAYTVGGTSTGCSNLAVGYVIVPSVPKPDICMVTVDSLNKYNEIYWDKTLYPMLDSMIIYRQVSTNVYRQIGAVSKTALSMFKDTARSIGPANGDPNISTYRYKLQIRDTCGKYGPKSLWHNTVYFIHSGGVFYWINNYSVEGTVFPTNPVQTYSLMVCPNPSVSTVFTAIGITTGNQFTLNDPNYLSYQNTADWRVEADLGYSCNATLKTTAAKIGKSRSNIQNNRIIGIKENSLKNNVMVYPNPAHGILNIDFATANEDVEVNLINVIGQSVYSDRTNRTVGIKTIDVSVFAKGIYVLSLTGKSGKAQYKIVVE